MTSRFFESISRAAALTALTFLLLGTAGARSAVGGTAEDTDSPTPVLLSETGSTRALARLARSDSRTSVLPKDGGQAFRRGSKIDLFVSNLALMTGEGSNAFRVYATDSRGNIYRYPVVGVRFVENNVWALTTLLVDEIGYYPPAIDGDVLVYVTWRGLASNRVRLGLGRTGGDLKEPVDSKPTPLVSSRLATAAPEAALTGREADRVRFQEQAAFGPTPALTSQLSRTKLANWIQDQFLQPYPDAAFPYPSQPLKPSNPQPDCDGEQTITPDVPFTCFRDTYSMYPIQTWNSVQMLYGTNQLRHKVSWALSQIWVTSGQDIQQSRHMVEYHKILSNNAFGNYRQLMREMTLSPTMGEYLNMNQSTRTNPNENYARELMQLFTIGLFMLNPDGTVQCVEHNPCLPGDTAIPSYDQNNVNNLTKVLTGWSGCSVPASCPNLTPGVPDYIDPLLLNAGVGTVGNNRHDLTAKTLLTYPNAGGTTIAACGNCTTLANISIYAYASLDQALDNIFYHPNLGPYVSKILIQQMVTSDPSPAYVGRVAAAFNDNGVGVRGDMKAVVMAILLDPEARGNLKSDPNYGKLREPVTYAANFFRAFNVRNAAGTGQSDGVFTVDRGEYNAMGQIPFRSPTVFNYYPPSFVIPGTTLLGPEFALMTTGTAITRANFINRMVGYNGTGGTFAGAPIPVSANVPSGTSLDLSDLVALSNADPNGYLLVDELSRRLMHNTMSVSMHSSIRNAVLAIPSSDGAGRVRQAVYLAATSSQYQVQR